MEMTGHRTRAVFKRYAIVDEGMLREAAEKPVAAMASGGSSRVARQRGRAEKLRNRLRIRREQLFGRARRLAVAGLGLCLPGEWAGTLPAVRLPGVRCLLYDRLDLEKLVEQGKN